MGKILVFGDSLVYGKWDSEGGWVTRLRKHVDETYNIGKSGNMHVYNLGIPGEVAIRMKDRLRQELSSRVDMSDTKGNNLVLFSIGLNDANPANWLTLKQTSKDEFKSVLKEFVSIAKDYSTKIVFIGLTPINENRWLPNSKFKGKFFTKDAVEYENYLTEVCEEMNLLKISLYEELIGQSYQEHLVDGVHADGEGHEMIFQLVKGQLNDHKLIEYCK